ncbi:hypothetical protein TH66_06005 [Carbonactinospora thermoautotrophica]|uniref:Uncharacterized protein n=1 Tax=Carbonactinospora thermoautotrophica TaxID=1469144 RepID=A0A132N3L5_9ACTN|nr:helix-turn-helix transcriptional regulator [Carbonactinospora thermoautotrophica]KWX04745.1 hypothetical protein TH66_06005 [Carbonactinospora thermoautotrophica]KWX09699.1 hypothetical protein TR74_08015 [Carbonactinospora thermoautotrophica]
MAHGRACAARIRELAQRAGWPLVRTAAEIVACCQVTPLRAWRLAHGWPLEEAADRLDEVCARIGLRQPHLGKAGLSCYELGKHPVPMWLLDPLCRLYQTRPDWLGFGGDYSGGEPGERPLFPVLAGPGKGGEKGSTGDLLNRTDHQEDPMRRRELLRTALAGLALGSGLTPQAAHALELLRQDAEHTVRPPALEPTTLDEWEHIVEAHGYALKTAPPLSLLGELAADFAELQALAQRGLRLHDRKHVYYLSAQLAALMGVTLLNLGEPRDAWRWFNTAQAAAEENGDRALRGWVLTRKAISGALPRIRYGADPVQTARLALRLTEQAQALTRNIPCAAHPMAHAVEASARSWLGDRPGVSAAINRARDAFARLDAEETRASSFCFPEQQMRSYFSGSLTRVGLTREAYREQQAALPLYSPNETLEPTLIRLHQAECLVRDGDVTEGCRSTVRVILDLPEERRAPILWSYAREVARSLPKEAQHTPAARDLREFLASSN